MALFVTSCSGTGTEDGGRRADAGPSPVASCPGASNTGVPPGTVLQPMTAMTIRTAGTVIENKEITGCVTILANDVTIRRSRIFASVDCAIRTGFGDYSGILIEDVEVDGSKNPNDHLLVGSAGYTCRRCNIHHSRTALGLAKDVVIEDSWVHDTDAATNAVHKAAASGHGSDNIVLRHNTLLCDAGAGDADVTGGCSSAVSFYGTNSAITNVRVEDNCMATTGRYCTYAGSLDSKPYPTGSNIQYVNNHFLRTLSPYCGVSGPVAGWKNGNGNVWSGNVWDNTTDPVCIDQAQCPSGLTCNNRGSCVQ
ncbi:hypothetical protein [Pendulispora albinea]|uniref:Right handed beta helix domain-containing protein n=1 Tax=Pendulispora albinea TaxID=2741071 RepID=A0ABZ2LK40_9BACT